MFLWVLILVGLVLSRLYWRRKNRKFLEISKELPGPPTVPLLGNALRFLNTDIIELFRTLVNEYGTLVRFWLGPDLNIIVSDPEDLKILLSSSKTSEKGVQYKYMRVFIGEGILGGSGPIWRRHRKIATPNFSKRAVEGFTDLFNEEADNLLKKLQGVKGQEIDMYKYVVQSTTYSVCRGVLGLTKEQTMSLPFLQDCVDLSPRMYDLVFSRMTQWWQQIEPVYWMTSSFQLEKRFKYIIETLFGKVVNHRSKALEKLGMAEKAMIANCKEDSQDNVQISVVDRFILSGELDYMELIQENFTLFTASQEASAKIASFLLLMMAYHADCQERLYQEILDVVGDDSSVPVTEEHLRQMPYLEMVFKEIIRMFPIGVALQRKVIEDISITKTTLPAGCSLVIPIFHIQRDPRYWKNPNAFDPDRFTPENSEGRPAYAYIPFSLGPMDCLGRHFGTKLVKTIAIKVLQTFKITSNQTYADLRIIAAISVKSKDGYRGTLTPRVISSEENSRRFNNNLKQNVIRPAGIKI